jgi:hypothetical protein
MRNYESINTAIDGKSWQCDGFAAKSILETHGDGRWVVRHSMLLPSRKGWHDRVFAAARASNVERDM